MPDPEQAQEGEDFTVTLVGRVTDEAWDRLAAELDEIRSREED